MSDTLQLVFNVLVLVLAIIAGLWFGHQIGESSSKAKDGKPRRSFGKAVQAAATTSAVRLWQWQRARKKQRARDGAGE